MCVSIPFSKLHEHACSYCFSYGIKDCLQANYGDVVKFIASLEFHVSMLVSNIDLSLLFDVACIQMHCLPISYNGDVALLH